MLVGSMNPCPCGNYGNPEKECSCSPFQVKRYRSKISGPLLDRIDIHLEVPALKTLELTQDTISGEPSSAIRNRVMNAREIQKNRFKGTKLHNNAQMGTRHIRKHCRLNQDCRDLLKNAIEKLGISGRAYDRILKVSRTIADLEAKESIESAHLAEAIQYRAFDKRD
jgi:magnesium chelatase family protein